MKTKKRRFYDEFDTGFSHEQITKAIWKAKLSTEFIREHFQVHEDTDQEGQIYRFYKIDEEGLKAISPALKKTLKWA